MKCRFKSPFSHITEPVRCVSRTTSSCLMFMGGDIDAAAAHSVRFEIGSALGWATWNWLGFCLMEIATRWMAEGEEQDKPVTFASDWEALSIPVLFLPRLALLFFQTLRCYRRSMFFQRQ